MTKLLKTTITLTLFILILFNVERAFSATILIEADKQDFQLATNTANFNGNVRVNYGGISIKSSKASLTGNTGGQPDKAVFTSNVSAVMKDTDSTDEITSDSLTLLLASNQMIAEGNTYSNLKKNSPAAITIRAGRQEFNNVTNEMKASGGVSINYKGMSISGSNATLSSSASGKPIKAVISGGARIVKGASTISASTISLDLNSHSMVASGGVNTVTSMNKAGRVSMSSDFQNFDKDSNTIIGSGHVRVIYQDYVATGPKATLYTSGNNLDKIIFSGGARIKDSAREVSANTISVSINPKNFTAEGNVKTQFVKQNIPKKGAKAPQDEPVSKPEKHPQPTPAATKPPEDNNNTQGNTYPSNEGVFGDL